MEFFDHSSVILNCYLLYFILYGFLVLAVETTTIYAGFSFLIIPSLLYLTLRKFALPKPNEHVVKEVLGGDIWEQFRENDLNALNNIEPKGKPEELYFRTIAHRAAGLDAPENSISALKLCNEKGCCFVEIDLSLTKDGVPIVFHDSTLERMIGIPGNVEDYLWEDLKNLNLIYHPDMKDKKMFSNEKIALFEDFIKLCVDFDIRVFIDIKDKNDKVVKIILETYKRNPSLYKRSLISSFNPFIIYKIRKNDSNILCSMAWRPQYFRKKKYNPYNVPENRYNSFPKQIGAVIMDYITTWLFNNIVYFVVGMSAVLLHKDSLSPGVIAMWQKRKIRVIAWTVNSRTEKDYFSNVLNIPYMTDTLVYNHINVDGDKGHCL